MPARCTPPRTRMRHRTEACDGAALPPVLGPPAEQRPHHGGARRSRGRPVARCALGGGDGLLTVGHVVGQVTWCPRSSHAMAAMASSQLIRLLSGSHASPEPSCPAEKNSTRWNAMARACYFSGQMLRHPRLRLGESRRPGRWDGGGGGVSI